MAGAQKNDGPKSLLTAAAYPGGKLQEKRFPFTKIPDSIFVPRFHVIKCVAPNPMQS